MECVVKRLEQVDGMCTRIALLPGTIELVMNTPRHFGLSSIHLDTHKYSQIPHAGTLSSLLFPLSSSFFQLKNSPASFVSALWFVP